MAYPAGGTALTVTYTYLLTNDLTAIKQGTTNLAAWAYDDIGSRTALTFANGVVQAFTFDPVSRLASLGNALAGTANDLTKTYAYNPASQITQETKSNNVYAFPKTNISETGTANGLNQLTSYASKSLTHDTKGNVTGFGSDTFVYSSENLLKSASVAGASTTLSYDPLLRLYQTVSGATTSRFAYDGLDAIAEYNASNALQRRYVFDPTGITGQPLIWYEGTGIAATVRRYLSADERGSIISVSDSVGNSLAVNSYDEYGIPYFGALANQRFGYTGQAWIGSAGLWHLNARAYHPELGRFMQPDPIGYVDSPNLYAYVLNDPVNWVDPLGLCQFPGTGSVTFPSDGSVVISCPRWDFGGGAGGSVGSVGAPGEPGTPKGRLPRELREGAGKDPREACVKSGDNTLETVDELSSKIGYVADAAVVVGFIIAPVNPVLGGALILGGRVAGSAATGAQLASAFTDFGRTGNSGRLISATGSFGGSIVGGRLGSRLGARVFGNQQIRNARGQFGEKRATAGTQFGQSAGAAAGGICPN